MSFGTPEQFKPFEPESSYTPIEPKVTMQEKVLVVRLARDGSIKDGSGLQSAWAAGWRIKTISATKKALYIVLYKLDEEY